MRTQTLVHRWENKTRISAPFRRQALPGLFEGWLVLTRVSCKIFSIIFRASNHQIVDKEDYIEFLFKLSYLYSNFTLTFGYINPALRKTAQKFSSVCGYR